MEKPKWTIGQPNKRKAALNWGSRAWGMDGCSINEQGGAEDTEQPGKATHPQ